MERTTIYTQGLKIFLKILKRRFFGFKRYSGTPEQICRAIIEDCWNKKGFFQVSNGHFNLFYMRDFGWCCSSLIQLGYKDRVKATLGFALKNFKKTRKITTCITKNGKCFDFPCYSVDSLPYLIKCLNLLGDQDLLNQYQDFLNQEIERFFNIVIDKKSGLVKKNTYFSSMRDHAVRNSSCYDNCFVAMLKNELQKTHLANPLKQFNYETLLKKNFWNGRYFYSDLNRNSIVTADANLFPFYLDIFFDLKMLKSAFKNIIRSDLDKPFPLRYTKKTYPEEEFIPLSKITKNYETSAAWTHMGPLFIDLMRKVDKKKAQEYLDSYIKTLSTYKNYLEVFNKNGKPYTSWLYQSDVSMLWSANLLSLLV